MARVFRRGRGICGANEEISRDASEILGFGIIQLFLSKH